MNSRERVLAAACRQRTDRPPSDLDCTPEAWEALRRYLGVKTNTDVLDTLDIDVRWVSLPFKGPQERSAVPLGSEGTDFWGCRIRKVETSLNTYFEFEHHPLESATSVEQIENYSWPSLDWWDYSAVPGAIQEANRKGDKAIILFLGGAFETPWYIRGFEKFLLDLYEAPEMAAAICRHVEEYYRQRAIRVIDVADGQIDVVGSGGDVGSQRGMLLSPQVWRERIKPYTANLISTFKEMGFVTLYHSCGSCVPIIDDLIEAGLDFLDPIQVTAAGMKPAELFPRFGDRLSFHGAIDEVELLPHATPEEVYKETMRIIDVLGANGGYVVAPSHSVQGDTPPENVVAIFDAVRDYRW